METSTGLQVRAAQSARMSTLDRPLICPMPPQWRCLAARPDTEFGGESSFKVKQFQIRFKCEESVSALPGNLSKDLLFAHQGNQLIRRTIIYATDRRGLINAQNWLLEQLLQ